MGDWEAEAIASLSIDFRSFFVPFIKLSVPGVCSVHILDWHGKRKQQIKKILLEPHDNSEKEIA